jgi:hypothetical protein
MFIMYLSQGKELWWFIYMLHFTENLVSYCLFIPSAHSVMVEQQHEYKLQRMWKKSRNLRYYSSTCLGDLRKTV